MLAKAIRFAREASRTAAHLRGLGVQLVCVAVITQVTHPSAIGLAAAIAAIAATVTYIAGLGVLAKAKGYSAAWCLLGLSSVIGLSVVLSLPDLE